MEIFKPIKIRDTVKAIFIDKSKKKLKNQDGGIVVFRVKVSNKHNKVIQTGSRKMIIRIKLN